MTSPMMMDPLHSAMNVAPINSNSYHHQYNSNTSFGNQGHDGYHGDQGRHVNAPGPYRADSRADNGSDRACMVWVNGLNPNMTEQALVEVFRQFGNVVSCVRKHDGNKPNGSQYAFIKYTSPQEAQYAINIGEADIQGYRVVIKSRNVGRAHKSSGSSDYKSYDKAGQQILGMINKNNHRSLAIFDGNMDQPHGNGAGRGHTSAGPPVLMSKALVVANIPQEMCPKGFYMLFSEVGPVDGCYIFPQYDHLSRRFGHVVMKSFYMAQKCVEIFHGRPIQGSILDVSYLKTPPDVEPLPMTSPAPPVHMGNQQPGVMFHTPPPQVHPFYNQPQPPMGMGWPQQGMSGVPLPGHYGAMPPQFVIPHPPQAMPPTFSGQAPIFNQTLARFPDHSQSPPPPQGIHWMPQERRQFSNGRQYHRYPAPPPGFTGRIPYVQAMSPGSISETQSRSVSNSSESTMVSTAPSSEEPIKGELVSYSREQYRSDSDPDMVGDAGNDTSTSTAAVAPVFEILNPQVIPETRKPMDPCNLFVKNLDDDVVGTAEDLQAVFEKFGPVASVHLVTYDESKISKGFGFVAFTKAEDAARAKDEINNSLIGRKRVFVSYAEKKEDRAKRLKSLFSGSPDDEGARGKGETTNSLEDPSKPVEAGSALFMAKGLEEKSSSKTTEEPLPMDAPMTEKPILPTDFSVAQKSELFVRDENKVQGSYGAYGGKTPEISLTEHSSKTESIKAIEGKKLSPPKGKLTNSANDLDTHLKNAVDAVLQNQLVNKPGNKRTTKKGVGSQKAISTKIQVAVPIMRNGSSLGRSSRIPIQNKNAQMPTNPLTGPRLQDGLKEKPITSANAPPKKRGYKGNRTNGRNSDRNPEAQKNIAESHDVGKTAVGQVGITVSAH